MQISNLKTNHGDYSFITKPNTTLVITHITADLGPNLTTLNEMIRSLYCDLLLSGADGMSRTEFLDAVNGAGGSIGIKAHEGRITITIETIASRLPKILPLAKKMLLKPTFAPKEITRAKETCRQQLRLAEAGARAMAQTNLVQSLYTPLDRAYLSTPKEGIAVLKDINKKHFQELHQRFMQTQWKVTIGGNSTTINEVKSTLSNLRETTKEGIELRVPESTEIIKVKAKLFTQQITSQQNIEVSIGQRLPLTLDEVDYPAVTFAIAVLGKWGGFSGRLMSTVREKEGLTYGIYAKTEAVELDAFGHWRIMTFFHPNDLERGILSTLREINKLYRSGITKAELNRFKTILTTNHVLLFDSLASLTGLVHTYHTKGISFPKYEEIIEQIQKLTTKDVNNALKKYLDPAALSYSLAGNLNDLSPQLKTLQTRLKL